MNILIALSQTISQGLKVLYGIDTPAVEIQLQETRREFTGDFTLVVFPYLKQARRKPEVLADELGSYVQQNLSTISGYNVIKGFLNFQVDDQYWRQFLTETAVAPQFGLVEPDPTAQPIVVEYSSPNTNKPLHLGHIRNNLLGWSVSTLLKAAGKNVKMVNLVNDRGIHICKSMLAWERFSGGETPETSGLKGDHLVGKYYVEFDKHYKEQVNELVANGVDPETASHEAPFIKEAGQMLQRWEQGDPETRALWEKMNQWVYAGFDQTYARLGIHFDKVYYESQTYLLGKQLVQQGLDSGVLFRKPDGSVWCDLTADGLDQKLLLRSDGTSVYITQDLGTALLRQGDFNAQQLIYVVGNEQDYHFKVLKLILSKLGFQWAEKLYHLSYGMVELPNGKMKSREGTVVDADDLIDEMEQQAAQLSNQRGKNDDLTPVEQEHLHHTIALGALKYFILKVDPAKNILFNPAESIDFNGNTGPFIQYTHARIRSIIRKAPQQTGKVDATNVSLNEKERLIIKQLHALPATIQNAATAFNPAMIATYAYELAKSYNSFYQDTPILRNVDPTTQQFRIALSVSVANALNNTLSILGIEAPESM